MNIRKAVHTFAIPAHQLGYLRRLGLLSDESRFNLSFDDLVRLRFILRCRENKIALKKIRNMIMLLQPEQQNSGEEWFRRLELYGSKRLLLRDQERLIEPETGQLWFDLGAERQENTSRIDSAGQEIEEESKEAELEKQQQQFLTLLEQEGGSFESMEEGSADRLRSILKQMLVLDSAHPAALIELGNLAFARGERDQALHYYEEVLLSHPEQVEALYNIANIYFKEEKYAASIRYFHDCLTLDPDFAEPLFNLGVVYFSLGYYDAARTMLESYLEFDDDSIWSEQASEMLDRMAGVVS